VHSEIEEYIKSKKYREKFEELDINDTFTPELIELTESGDDKVRVRAIYALGRIIESGFTKYREEIIQALVKGLRDPCDWVRGHSAHFLGRINYPEEGIIKLFEDSCPWVRHRSAEAAGLIGMRNPKFAEKAISGLKKLLNDRSSHVQYIALEAVKKIADKNQEICDGLKDYLKSVLHESRN